jgi:hypothetical protein
MLDHRDCNNNLDLSILLLVKDSPDYFRFFYI